MESGSNGSYSGYSNGNNGDSKGLRGGKDIECPENIIFELEDVGRCPYYKSSKNVPPIGTYVALRNSLYNNRLAIEDSNQIVIGLIPIEHNNLFECIKNQFNYSGSVTDSSDKTTPYVEVEIIEQ